MRTASTTTAATGGIVAATLASLAFSPAVALGTGIAVTAGAGLLFGERSDPLVGGLVLSLVLGLLTLAPVIPPAYPAAIGVALVAAAGLGLAAAELGVRAGTIVDAKSIGKTEYGRAWLAPTAVLAISLLCWRLGAGGRVLLGGVVGLVLGTHFVLVHFGAPVVHQAVTLVPVALVLFVALPIASGDDYVVPGVEPSPLRRAVARIRARRDPEASDPADAATADGDADPVRAGIDDLFDGSEGPEAPTADAGTGAGDAGEAVPDAPTAGSGDGAASSAPAPTAGDGATSASPGAADPDGVSSGQDDAVRAASGSAAPSSVAEQPAGDTDQRDDGRFDRLSEAVSRSLSGAGDAASTEPSAPTPNDPGPDSAASESDTADRDRSGDESDEPAARACQNCAATTEDCESHAVLPDAELSVLLCADCREACSEAATSLAECRAQALPVDVAAAYRCERCDDGGQLEAHPVVPLDGGGHRHPNNVLALCADCHAAVAAHREASD